MQLYIEEGYNILNLLLYKHQQPPEANYYIFFQVIAYAILGVPDNYLRSLRNKGDNFSHQLATIIENVCLEPDEDIVENSIGCLRNFIAKCPIGLLCEQRDQFDLSMMDYILKIVKFVH